MKQILLALLVGTLLAGCGGEEEDNFTSADLDDPEIRAKIIDEAIDRDELRFKEEDGQRLAYLKSQQTPFTGWSKWTKNGRIYSLIKRVKGKVMIMTIFYENGLRAYEATFFDTKDELLNSARVWKPNGEICPVSKVVNGSGVEVIYKQDGTERYRNLYKDGICLIDGFSLVVAEKGLNAFYTQFRSKTSTFPDGGDLSEKSPAGFAAYVWDKWDWQQVDFWFLDDATEVPTRLGDGDGDLHYVVTSEQKKAISWEIAIPKEGATSNLNTLNRKRGKFPVMWTKGLQTDGRWKDDSPWLGLGGHVLWSDGTIQLYANTEGEDGNGVFLDNNRKRTKDVKKAIPEDWQILTPW